MYRIKEDARVRRSAETIYQGLSRCLTHKHLEDITPSDIQRVCGVSRATFYRIFDSMTDVLIWKCDRHFYTMLSSFAAQKKAEAERFAFVRYAFEYWTDNSLIVEQLIAVNRADIIYDAMLKHSAIIHDCFAEFFTDSSIDNSYFFAIRSGLVVSILRVWLGRGKQETPEQIAQIISDQLAFAVSNPVLL